MIASLQVVAGLVILLVGAEFLIRGAVTLAQRLCISPHVIGLTVIAFGTSLPELVVSMDAALTGSPGIALGNIVGSNIANLLLIGGIGAILAPILCRNHRVLRDSLVMVVATAFMVYALLSGGIARWEGILMLVMLAGYIFYAYRIDSDHDDPSREIAELAAPKMAMPKILILVVGGLVAVICGGELLVTGAVSLARQSGVAESVIAVTLVAFGTSVPEIATVVVAAYRKHADVALGNIIGSNIFNILAILGLVATVEPLPLSEELLSQQVWVMLAVTIAFVAVTRITHRLGRSIGILLLMTYLVFVWSQFNDLPFSLPGFAA